MICKKIKELWPKAKKASKDEELLIALGRIGDSYLRQKLEDKLIDYWVGLKSLFLPQDTQRDMTEAVKVGVSFYLGRSTKERRKIQNEIHDSHTMRSKIMHGKKGVGQDKLLEMVNKTQNYLKAALVKRIQEL